MSFTTPTFFCSFNNSGINVKILGHYTIAVITLHEPGQQILQVWPGPMAILQILRNIRSRMLRLRFNSVSSRWPQLSFEVKKI